MKTQLALAAIGALALAMSAVAAEPRFMSLRTDEANGRRGPSSDQPIVWIYKARGLPLKALAESGEYVQVRDPDGDTVWMHKSQMSPKRTVYVQPADEPVPLLRAPGGRGRPVALVEPRVIAALEACDGAWRKISVGEHVGWVPAEALFGAESCVGVAP